MMIIRLAFRNLWRHPRRTLFISILIILGSLIIGIAASILDGASKGMETSLVGSLTGHIALGAPSEEAYGIFGSEVPIVSDYEGIPQIDDGKRLFPVIKTLSGVESYTSIISGIVNLSIAGFSQKSVIFGIDPATYFSVLPDIQIVWGDPEAINNGGIFINEVWAKQAETRLQRPLAAGDSFTAAVAAKGSFRLRTFHLAGVYRYKAPSEALNRIVLADPLLVRSLINYTLGNSITTDQASNTAEVENIGSPDMSDSIDDLFNTAQDLNQNTSGGITLAAVEDSLKDTSQRDKLNTVDTAAWSFILLRKADDVSLSALKTELTKALKKSDIDVRIMDWYTAAGSYALMLFALKSAFNAGVLFLVAGAFMILINSLVISILERTGEIGTLRALGAQRSFIIRMVVLEILLLTLGSALIGIMIAMVILMGIAQVGIILHNPLLISLFGGAVLHPHVSLLFIIWFLVGTMLAALGASVYPVHLALSISPREAILDGEA